MKRPWGFIVGYSLISLFSLAGGVEAYNDLFRARIDYPAGACPRDIVAADIDQDGDIDLAVTNFGRIINEFDSISIFLNNGHGVFEIDTNLITGDGPRAVCSGFLYENHGDPKAGDGSNAGIENTHYPELAVLNGLTNTVSIFVNNAGTDFSGLPMLYAGQYPSAVCVARLRDQIPMDLIIGGSLSMDLIIIFNDGWGHFNQSDKIVLSNDVRQIKFADLDGDRDVDLVVATADLELLFNDGRGHFGPPVVYNPGPGYFGDACAADFDGDGDLDIAGTNADNKIVRWLNVGDGTFGTPTIFPASIWPSRIIASDLDRDGDYDLVMTDTHEDVVMVSVNDGAGNFSTEGKYSPGSGGPTAITVADIDNDNDDDVVSANFGTDNISVFFNKTHNARCIITPGGANVMYAYGSEPMTGIVYLGDFDNGYPAGDIDPFSLTINGLAPSTVSVVNDYPDIPGEVVKMIFDLDEMIRDYGAVWGWEPHYFRVIGQFADGTPFVAGGDINIWGFVPGDANANRQVDIGDAAFLMNYLFREGPAPLIDAIADANGDGEVDIGDAAHLINYIFKGGEPPRQSHKRL